MTTIAWGVEEFLMAAGDSLKTFRYYAKRNIAEATRKHLVTLLEYDSASGPPVAYGHLDPQDGIVWLGIAVIEGRRGEGWGKKMMKRLLEHADGKGIEEVSLVVDADNQTARHLYESFGFEYKEDARVDACWMVRKRTEKKMADTIGSLVDKLTTTGQKLFFAQEFLHEIRRIDFDQFKSKFGGEEGLKDLFEKLHKVVDLNIQRAGLVNEIDAKIIAIVRTGVAGGELDDGGNLQRAHKTY